MKVLLAENQVDISNCDLGDLQRQLGETNARLAIAVRDERAAALVTVEARKAVAEVQKKIDGVLDEMKRMAPNATPWADRRS